MADWRQYVDNFMLFNESPLLKGAGQVSHEAMLRIAHDRYEQFDSRRRAAEAKQADEDDLNALEEAQRQLTQKNKPDVC
ncbi:RhuM family protein [Rugamonas rubra]|uniref:RhuM family protein n=1 Tax=Rugamonas rubra TaxID=758825 RepID=UPI000B811E97|nr:RhuM family protein [Rugamonas rubra]